MCMDTNRSPSSRVPLWTFLQMTFLSDGWAEFAVTQGLVHLLFSLHTVDLAQLSPSAAGRGALETSNKAVLNREL